MQISSSHKLRKHVSLNVFMGFVSHRLMNFTLKNIEGSISTYLGQVYCALHDINELIPPVESTKVEQERARAQSSTFFMLFALYGLPQEIRFKIWGYAVVPDISTLDE